MAKPNYKPTVRTCLQRELSPCLPDIHSLLICHVGRCAPQTLSDREVRTIRTMQSGPLYTHGDVMWAAGYLLLSCRAMGMCHGTDRNRKISDSLRPCTTRTILQRGLWAGVWRRSVVLVPSIPPSTRMGHLPTRPYIRWTPRRARHEQNCRCRSPLDLSSLAFPVYHSSSGREDAMACAMRFSHNNPICMAIHPSTHFFLYAKPNTALPDGLFPSQQSYVRNTQQ
jgi:hypothetical protein